MADNSPRSIDIFFYGLFMDEALLRAKGLDPQNPRLAAVDNFNLVIGERATLIPRLGETVHGFLFSLTHKEIDSLYADSSVRVYRPEAVLAKVKNDSAVPALCFNLPTVPLDGKRNPQYAAKLKELAERVGLPAEYAAKIS
jgi:hypothetical protein